MKNGKVKALLPVDIPVLTDYHKSISENWFRYTLILFVRLKKEAGYVR